MMKDKTLCTRKGCSEPRWKGPTGTNSKLVLCEKHQHEDWNKRGAQRYAKKKAQQGKVQHTRTKPAPPVIPTPEPEPPPIPPGAPHLKVVLVDHRRDIVQRFDVPVLSSKALSDVKNAPRLLDFLRATGHVVIEVGEAKEPASS